MAGHGLGRSLRACAIPEHIICEPLPQVRAALRHEGADSPGEASLRHLLRDVAAAAITATVAAPLSHVPAVLASYQQAHHVPLIEAARAIRAASGVGGFFAGIVPRTMSIAGSLFVVPFTMEALHPYLVQDTVAKGP